MAHVMRRHTTGDTRVRGLVLRRCHRPFSTITIDPFQGGPMCRPTDVQDDCILAVIASLVDEGSEVRDQVLTGERRFAELGVGRVE